MKHGLLHRLLSVRPFLPVIFTLIVCTAALGPGLVIAEVYEGSVYEDFERIRQLRGDGDYDKAIELLESLLTRYQDQESTLKEAYHEMVFTLLAAGRQSEAERTAEAALLRFPDLRADTLFYPPTVNDLYERLRSRLFGSLVLTTEPPGCDLFIDGTHRGQSPLRIEYLTTGEHELVAKRDGYVEKSVPILINPHREKAITTTLEKGDPFELLGRARFGLEVGINRVDYRGSSSLLGIGDAATRFSLGLFLSLQAKPRLWFEPGLRFVRLGNDEIIQDYLFVPLLFKFFPSGAHGFYFAAGPDVGVFLEARTTVIAVDEMGTTIGEGDIDISQGFGDFNVTATVGLGYEIRWKRAVPFIGLYYSHGVKNVLKNGGTAGLNTSEFRASVGLIF